MVSSSRSKAGGDFAIDVDNGLERAAMYVAALVCRNWRRFILRV